MKGMISMKGKKGISLALVLMVSTGLFGCNQSKETKGHALGKTTEEISRTIEVIGADYPLTIKDTTTDETVLEKVPEKVAVISGTPLSIWYDLGGKSICSSDISENVKLVEGYEEEIKSLPSVGPVYSIDMERIVSEKPDLIIAQYGTQGTHAKKLREMGFNVIVTSVKTYKDVVDTYIAFGKILKSEESANKRIAELEQKKAEIISKLPDQETSVVILYVTANALSVKLNNSIAGDVSNVLKLRNIASGLPVDTIGSENTPLDIEYIVRENPDYVFVTSMIASNEAAKKTMEEHFASNPAWRSIPAITEGRVIYLPQEHFLFNSGPYYSEAIEYVARSIYPEIYGEVDGWYGK